MPGKRWLLLALLVLPLYGCDEEYCDASVEDPISALLVGFLVCQGRDVGENPAPTAAFTMTPNPVSDGASVTFDASASEDASGGSLRYEWDLDGVPDVDADAFELDQGDTAVFERSLSIGGVPVELQRSIGLRVTERGGKSATARQTLTVRPASGVRAAFTIDPNPAAVGATVTFDASGSSGAAAYGWDFDGDGQLDERSREPVATHVYATPGERDVRLHVESLIGQAADATATLAVVPAAAGGGAEVAAVAQTARARGHGTRPGGRRFRARLTGVSFPADLGAGTRRGAVVRFAPVRSSGRLRPAGGRLGALPRFRAADWVARLALTSDLRKRTVAIRGLVLATLPRERGQACLRLTLGGPVGQSASGRFTLVGGTGAARRLAVRGRFRHRFTGTELRLRGRVRSRARSARPLPRRCAGLARRATGASRGRGDAARVRKFLRGRRFSTFRSTSIDPPSSIERHYDFCRGGRVRYESVFINTGSEESAIDSRTPVCERG